MPNSDIKVYVTTGMSGSGKDTFAEFIHEEIEALTDKKETLAKFSCVDVVKSLCRTLGWDGVRDEKGRKFISDITLALEAYNNMPLQNVLDKIIFYYRAFKTKYFFVDIREPYRIDKFKAMCKKENIQCFSVFIRRLGIKQILSNVADRATLEPYDYDYYIMNDKDLSDLQMKAKEFAKNMLMNEENNNEIK